MDNNDISTQFLYDNGLLTGIVRNNLVRIQFNYDKAGHIQRVRSKEARMDVKEKSLLSDYP